MPQPVSSSTPSTVGLDGMGSITTSAIPNLAASGGFVPWQASAAVNLSAAGGVQVSAPVQQVSVPQPYRPAAGASNARAWMTRGGGHGVPAGSRRQLDAQPQTSIQAGVASSGTSLPPVQVYLSVANPVASTGSTQLTDGRRSSADGQNDQELQQVMDLSQIEDELRTSYDRTFALMAQATTVRLGIATGLNVQATSTPAAAVSAQNLGTPLQPQLNAFAQPYVPLVPASAVADVFVLGRSTFRSECVARRIDRWTRSSAICSKSDDGNSDLGGQQPANLVEWKWMSGSGRPPGGAGAGAPSPDPDPGGDDPDKKKRHKEIDSKRKGEFQIDSESLKAAKSRPRGNMKCEVERFERGTDLTIKDWINQMETYFTVGQVPPEAFVGFMLMKIVPRHLNEIKHYQNLDYLEFREKLIEIFQEPDMATAYLNALSSVAQERDESISDFMHRVRLLVLKAHPNLDHTSRERILVTSFMLGLYDKQLAANLAVVKVQTAADAERLAAEGEAVRRDQKTKRTSNYSLMESARDEDLDDEKDIGLLYSEESDCEDITATLNDRRNGKRNASTGQQFERRKATAATKCYGCGHFGHYKSDCPRRGRPTAGRTRNQPVECLLCGANHYARDCPQLESAKQFVAGSNLDRSTKGEPKQNSSRPSTLGEASAAFKKDGTAVVYDAKESPVKIVDPALPAMSEESTPGAPENAVVLRAWSSANLAGVDSGRLRISAKSDR